MQQQNKDAAKSCQVNYFSQPLFILSCCDIIIILSFINHGFSFFLSFLFQQTGWCMIVLLFS